MKYIIIMLIILSYSVGIYAYSYDTIFNIPTNVDDISLDENSSYFTIADGDTVKFYDNQGTRLWSYDFNIKYHDIMDVEISENARLIAASISSYDTDNHKLVVFRNGNMSDRWEYRMPENTEYVNVDVSENGKYVALAVIKQDKITGLYGIIGDLIVFDYDGNKVWETNLSNVGGGKSFHDIEIIEDGNKVLLQSNSHILIYSKYGISDSFITTDSCWQCKQADISKDGRYIAIGNMNRGYVSLYELIGSKYVLKWMSSVNRDSVRYLSLSADSSTLIVGANDGNDEVARNGFVGVYSVGNGKNILEYDYDDGVKVSFIDVSYNGSVFTTGTSNGLDVFQSTDGIYNVHRMIGSRDVQRSLINHEGSVVIGSGFDSIFGFSV